VLAGLLNNIVEEKTNSRKVAIYMSTLYEPSAYDYIESAKEANRISGTLLPSRFGSLNAEEEIRLQYSLGLTFHAAELAGKAILRSLNIPQEQIRKEHGKHKLDKLWKSIWEETREKSTECYELFTGFCCTSIEIEGQTYGTTNGMLLDDFLPIVEPRNYLYPDSRSFNCPNPLNTLFIVVSNLIEVAEKIEAVMAKECKDANL
jgi:hypothetical protein